MAKAYELCTITWGVDTVHQPPVVAEEEDKDADKETNRIELRALGELAGGSVLAE